MTQPDQSETLTLVPSPTCRLYLIYDSSEPDPESLAEDRAWFRKILARHEPSLSWERRVEYIDNFMDRPWPALQRLRQEVRPGDVVVSAVLYAEPELPALLREFEAAGVAVFDAEAGERIQLEAVTKAMEEEIDDLLAERRDHLETHVMEFVGNLLLNTAPFHELDLDQVHNHLTRRLHEIVLTSVRAAIECLADPALVTRSALIKRIKRRLAAAGEQRVPALCAEHLEEYARELGALGTFERLE